MDQDITDNASTRQLYEDFARYPFEEDQEFLDGLNSILQSNPTASEEEKRGLAGRAKAFYFSRMMGQQMTWEGYLAYRGPSPPPEPPEPLVAAPPHLPLESLSTGGKGIGSSDTTNLSFAELSKLIAEGKTDAIPFNRVIPEAVSDAPPSEPQAAPRKKPWEK